MNPGRLNRRITVQQQSSVQDEVGQPVQTWADHASLWADVRTQGGLEAIKAGGVRMVAGINAGMRVLLGESVYNITAVLPDEAGRRHMDLLCEVAQ